MVSSPLPKRILSMEEDEAAGSLHYIQLARLEEKVGVHTCLNMDRNPCS